MFDFILNKNEEIVEKSGKFVYTGYLSGIMYFYTHSNGETKAGYQANPLLDILYFRFGKDAMSYCVIINICDDFLHLKCFDSFSLANEYSKQYMDLI
jgi:hypothetical protein